MSISSSGAITTTGVISGSNAATASSVANLNQNVQITGSLGVTSTITAQTLNVQTVTSSIVYSSGSNIFGNSLSNTQQMTGSLSVTGSTATFAGSVTGVTGNFTNSTSGNTFIIGTTYAGGRNIQIGISDGSILPTAAAYINDNTGVGVYIGDNTAATKGLYVKNGGNVGIGTTTPQRQFVIANSSGDGLEISNSSGYSTLLAYNRTTSAYQNIVLTEGTGKVLIGTTSDNGAKLQVNGQATINGLGVNTTLNSGWGTYSAIQMSPYSSIFAGDDGYRAYTAYTFGVYSGAGWSPKYILSNSYVNAYRQRDGAHEFLTAGTGTAGNAISFTQVMTITNGGKVMVHTTDSGPNAYLFASANMNQPYPLGSKAEDTSQGLVGFFDNGNNTIGSISRSGDVVSYNSFLGSHWSQLLNNSKPEILKGTILEAIDELCRWDGQTNDRLAKVKISDTLESKNVYGIFLGWDNTDDFNDLYVAALGAGYIRVNSSEVVSMGDLLQSNGDGTAKVQSDDIIRSSTIAKVVSTQKIETYEDGSYLIAATIHCG
jgi:hypothetical protein